MDIKTFKEQFKLIENKAFIFAKLISKYKYRNNSNYIYAVDWINETDDPNYCAYSGSNSIEVNYSHRGDSASIDIPFDVLEMSIEEFEQICIDYKEKQDAIKKEDQKKKEEKEYQTYLKLQEKYET